MILAVVLAPTDAALGQAVVTEPRVPPRIRQALNVESGLNDGICVPLLFAAVAVADVESEISEGRGAATLAARGDRLRRRRRGDRRARGRGDRHPRGPPRPDRRPGGARSSPPPGAALAYGTASALGGSGFIAAFVAGMTFRLALKRDPGEHQRAQRGGRQRAQRRHVRALRGDPARPRARRVELGARPLRRAQPDGRAHAAGRDRDARHARAERRRSASSAGSVPAAWRRSCSP